MKMSAFNKDEYRHHLIWTRLVPVSLLACLYVTDMATDIAAASQLYSTGDVWSGCVCASLIFLPVLVFCIYEFIVILVKHKCSWNRALRILSHLFFSPVMVLLRFTERIFWLVEAVSVTNEADRDIAVLKAYEPRRIEIYLFIRPLLQSVPQSFLQMFLLIYLGKVEIRLIQVLSMLSAIVSFSVIAANYQRFESQEETVMPWIYKKPRLQPDDDAKTPLNIGSINRETEKSTLKPQISLQEITKVSTDLNFGDNSTFSQTLPRKFRYANTSLQADSFSSEQSSGEDSVIEAVNKNINPPDVVQNNVLPDSPPPPIPPRYSGSHNAPARPPPSKHTQISEADKIESEGKIGTRVSFLRHSNSESSAASYSDNRRSSYHYLQASVSGSSNRSSDIKIISVPDFVAPPPPAPPTPKTIDPLSVALPTRKKGSKFLASDNPMSYFVILLKWFLFVGSRLIALGGLFALKRNSLIFMLLTLASLIAHVVVMFVIISVNCNKKAKCWWKNIIVSISSLFCLLEIGVKFEKYTRIMVIYWPLCFVENLIAAFVSFRPDLIVDIYSWWYAYLFYTTISTYILSVSCMLFNTYVIIPKTYVIYDD